MPSSDLVLIGSYDPSLVVLSVFISILAAYASLDLAGRVTSARGNARAIWLGGGALAMGLGIWSMHYVGMLALKLPVPIQYDWPTALLSLLAAVLASLVALIAASNYKMGITRAILGSVLMGSGIAAMHYIGMEAMRLPAMCVYSPALVAVSIAMAVVISFVAILLTFNLRGQQGAFGWKKPASALLMGLAIPTMHYTGMAAATFLPAPLSVNRLAHAVSVSSLGIAGIIVATSMVLGVVLLTARLDRKLARQSIELELNQQRYRRIVETTFDAFVGMDASGLIVDWNSRAESVFGWARSQALGKNLAQMLALEGDRSSKEEQLRFLMTSLEAVLLKKPMTMNALHRDGHEFPIEMTMAAIHVEDEKTLAVFIHDITDQVRDTEKLRSSIAELENLKRALDQHAIVARTDIHGLITYVNDNFCLISQYNRAELIGRDHQIVSSEDHPKEFIQGLWKTIQAGQIWRGEVKNRARDGSHYWLSTTIVPLCDAEGRPQEYIAIRTDITALKRIEEELRGAKEIAEQTSRSKSAFLASMSHEIRTPLNGIVGMTDLALGTELSVEQREYLDTVKYSADSLLSVINDILDFSKIEAGKVDFEAIDFDLLDCMESTLRTLALRADQKGVELLCEAAPGVPEYVRGDSSRLRQVVVNLIGNAIKFTDHGEVSLKIQLEPGGVGGHFSRFTVSDTGIGIAPGKLDSIFAPFTQADSSTTRKYGGTGLGLTISTRLVEMMGGKIWVESILGQGSNFHFTILLGVADPKNVGLGKAGSLEIMKGAKVLIVDDNLTNRRILEGMLNKWEMRAFTAESGVKALVAVAEARKAGDPFLLILSDMHMPIMDGFTLAENIRQGAGESHETLMMLTSAGHRGDAAQCQRLGVAAYLLKPVRQNELREAVVRALTGRGNPEPPRLITRYSLMDSGDSTRSLHLLLAEDNPVNKKLASRLLEKRGHIVTHASNGREAIEAAEKQAFDLILMDVQMPGMDGFEATAAIREKEREIGRHVPIIALTAHAMKGDKERCLAEGMDGYLSKPIHPEELDALLEKYVSGRSPAIRVAETVQQPG